MERADQEPASAIGQGAAGAPAAWPTHRGERDPAGHGARFRRVADLALHHHSGGVGLLWLATLGFLSQYFLNMEIERYTLATGETAVTGFSRFWKPWGIVFALGAILPNAFPGWAASA